jgi:hypothetical protein
MATGEAFFLLPSFETLGPCGTNLLRMRVERVVVGG